MTRISPKKMSLPQEPVRPLGQKPVGPTPGAEASADTASPPRADAFESGGAGQADLPTSPPPGAGGASWIRAQGAPTGRAGLEADLKGLAAHLDLALDALPDEAQAGARHALYESGKRILSSLDRGAITLEEAERAVRMLKEMTGALIALETGTAEVRTDTELEASSDLRGFRVTVPGGDELRVAVRVAGRGRGQARVKLENVKDDGRALPRTERMMIRFDLEGSSDDEGPGARDLAVIDVQFGTNRRPALPGLEKLNTRIHGVMLDEHGEPRLSPAGHPIANHHFTEGVPDALHDPSGFAAFARSFLDELDAKKAEEGA